jgi:hypothetical protein
MADLRFTPAHPVFRLPTPRELAALLSQTDGPEQLIAKLKRREEAIAYSEVETGDPFHGGCELDHWHHADLLLGLTEPDAADRPLPMMAALLGMETQALTFPIEMLDNPFWTLILLGGNRSGKSEYCAKRVMQHAMGYPGTAIVCLSETLEASIQNQQQLIWKYLPRTLKERNGQKDSQGIFHCNYSLKGGFTLEKLILPNRSQIFFKTYNQPPEDIEGWTLGNQDFRTIGGWADENCPLPWIQALRRRAGYYGALVLWSYTPVKGITPAIKELVGDTAETVMVLPSELLPNRVNVPGCPAGTMPYIQRSVTQGTVVLYFHSILNPFGTAQGTLYEGVQRLCAGRSSEVVQRLAYGYTKDTIGRAWPLFGAVNLIDPEELPSEGTNYLLVDPAGARNWACLWVRVASGNPASLYIYRDWPDAARYGEWAVPSANPNQPDGDAGPAQRSVGYGYSRYKQMFLREEEIKSANEPDPYRQQLWQDAADSETETFSSAPESQPVILREKIYERYIDPRAGRDERVAQKGGTCAIDELAKIDRDPGTNAVVAPSMRFRAAPGFNIEHGIRAVDTLLEWNPDQPYDRVMNTPHLFVSRSCRQVIWTLMNYTASGGEKGGCKDFADLLRYMATSRLRYIPYRKVPTRCMGSY